MPAKLWNVPNQACATALYRQWDGIGVRNAFAMARSVGRAGGPVCAAARVKPACPSCGHGRGFMRCHAACPSRGTSCGHGRDAPHTLTAYEQKRCGAHVYLMAAPAGVQKAALAGGRIPTPPILEYNEMGLAAICRRFGQNAARGHCACAQNKRICSGRVEHASTIG